MILVVARVYNRKKEGLLLIVEIASSLEAVCMKAVVHMTSMLTVGYNNTAHAFEFTIPQEIYLKQQVSLCTHTTDKISFESSTNNNSALTPQKQG